MERDALSPAAARGRLLPSLLATLLVSLATAGAAAGAATGELPSALTRPLSPLAGVARHEARAPDVAALLAEDAQRERDGLPPRFALPEPVSLTPFDAGTWEEAGQGWRVWRLRIGAPGALSLNLGFVGYRLPPGARLCVYPAAAPARALVFDADDNEEHGQLWTPVVPGDDLVVELTIAVTDLPALRLELGSVNVGYRAFGAPRPPVAAKSGACNVDVVCPEGDGWRDEIQAVAAISTGGSIYCTGFLVNNTVRDGRPLFMTANHCNVTALNAASLVAYWNFQSPACGDHGGGSLAQFQTGAIFRAAAAASDFTLVELDDLPDPDFQVAFAGWNRGAGDPTAAVTIHHPSGDEKSISFENDPLQTTTYLNPASPGDGTHLRVADWDLGTTEPGSSGSPLFDPDGRVVGQLHGGYAACGNDLSDWYGRLSVSWTGGGTPATRLSDWLDPLGTGATVLDTFAPYARGLRVTPSTGLSATGPVGGPFAPSSQSYTLENIGSVPLDWSVSRTAAWLSLDATGGTLAPAATVVVTASLNAAAAARPAGIHADTLRFTNLTDHAGDTWRAVRLQAGEPIVFQAWNMDADPGWAREGQWEHGAPAGAGGENGSPDPTAGHTGVNVVGYNLAGDYANSLPEQALTAGPIDCSRMADVTVRYWRWLGVETSAYDHAAFRVSSDGTTWTTVWENGGEVADLAWTEQVFDISALAAGRPAVSLRWTMGPTDASWRYCGWNLDDVSLSGFERSDEPEPALRTRLLPVAPNPFAALTDLEFELAAAGRARLAVHDLRGRLVRVLHEGELPAGRHEAAWEGRDGEGRRCASGAYVLRLTAGGGGDERKILLVR